MNDNLKVVMNWSSGKDAALAYQTILQESKYQVSHLLTTINEEHDRIFMHGVREKLLDVQARRMKLPLIKVKLPPSPDDTLYKQAMQQNLSALVNKGVTLAAYGDIFLEDLRTYREQQLQQVGMSAIFPLWKRSTRELVAIIEETGIKAIIVCVSGRHLGKEFLGKEINSELLCCLPENVDPCGENGEFHTFVYDAPFFSAPIPIITGETVHRRYGPSSDDATRDSGFYFLDLNTD